MGILISYEGDWTEFNFLFAAKAALLVDGTDVGFLVGNDVKDGINDGCAEGLAVGAILGMREGV